MEACKYPEQTEIYKDYFEALFDMSCFAWFQINTYIQTVSINNLIDHVYAYAIFKYNSPVKR